MSLAERRNIYLRIDRMIRLRMTGGPLHLAQRINISRSTFFRYIEDMRELGAPIEYNEKNQCYYYRENGGFEFGFLKIDQHAP